MTARLKDTRHLDVSPAIWFELEHVGGACPWRHYWCGVWYFYDDRAIAERKPEREPEVARGGANVER